MPTRFDVQEFYGLYVSGPVYVSSIAELKLAARIGAMNKINFVITPSLVGLVKVNKIVSIHTGVGMRFFRPTMQLGLNIKMNK